MPRNQPLLPATPLLILFRLAFPVGKGVTTEREIDSELIQLGDVLKVAPGETIPADGVVVQGRSCVNEAMITGGGLLSNIDNRDLETRGCGQGCSQDLGS